MTCSLLLAPLGGTEKVVSSQLSATRICNAEYSSSLLVRNENDGKELDTKQTLFPLTTALRG
jgi:hypothetical protein